MGRLLSSDEAKRFGAIIDTYQPNDNVLELFLQSKFLAIAGPAGAGKDTLRDALLQKYPEYYTPILSTTTRPQREGEIEGETYHFRDVEIVEEALQSRDYFQAALVHDQQISCLHVEEINRLNDTQTGVGILIPFTIDQLRERKPDLKAVFLIPPSIDTLRIRIKAERMLDEAEVNRRMQAAAHEIKRALQSDHYYCIVTDTIDNTAEKTHGFAQTGEINTEVDEYSREVMRMILGQLA